MNDPKRTPAASDETVHLNLTPFAPKAKKPAPPPVSPPAPTPAPEDNVEGVTMIIARAAAEVTSQPNPGGPPAQTGTPTPGSGPSKELLGAVAYSYVKGVYRSEDIARKMAKDPGFSAAAGNEIPDANAIRKLRRQNRGPIQEILTKFFRRQRKNAAAETMSQTMPGATPAVPPSAPVPPGPAEPPSETTIISRRDAAQQLDKAAWIDNMSKDD